MQEITDTPAEDKYCAYRFTNVGILDDIDGPDMSIKDIYADDPEAEGADTSASGISVF